MADVDEALTGSYTEHVRLRPTSLLDPGSVAVATEVDDTTGLTLAPGGPVAPFAAVVLRLDGHTGGAVLGLATQDGEQVVVRVTRRSLLVEVRSQGRTRILRRRRFRPPLDYSVAFVLCENQVTALVDAGEGWRPVVTERNRVLRHVDLRSEETLQQYCYAWQVDGSAHASVRAGLFGGVGLRDPHLVQYADGTPYQRHGRLYLTWSAAGLGFFPQAHWTVWSMDPAAPEDLRLEGHLFFRRDGLVLGDHAGHLVRDGDRWIVAVSSWGDFDESPVHVRHASSSADLLSGTHVLETQPLRLPTRHGSWDPALLRADGDWWVAFVESPSQDPFVFHPALARTSQHDWTAGLAPAFAAADYRQCEGPRLVAGQSAPRVLASDKDSRSYPLVDAGGHLRGRLDAPYPSNIPHPQLVPEPGGGWWLVTFDGTAFAPELMGYGGHGDVVVMRCRART